VNVVIPSEARNLALETKDMRDSSSPAAPQNDRLDGFFSILLGVTLIASEMSTRQHGAKYIGMDVHMATTSAELCLETEFTSWVGV